MGRQRTAVQINQFIGGLNTESNPLSFPENCSLDEQNMELQKDGSRKRRPGFDVEVGASFVDSGIVFDPNVILGRSQFLWENPGGISSKQFLVVQIGNYLAFHDLDVEPISSATKHSVTYNVSTYSTTFTYASIDGSLIVATGLKEISVFSYDGTNISKSDETLLIRDFFGLYTSPGGVPVKEPENYQHRPTTIPDKHLYNLRNQTFARGVVRGDVDNTNVVDPIVRFNTVSGSEYPSNADSLVRFLIADANLASNRTVERFNAESMIKTTPGTTHAPIGYFIIDALERGASRNAQEAILRANNGNLTLSVGTLNTDITPGGAKIVTAYAGKVWYAGFSSEVVDGDKLSPRMGSYVLFSQTVENISKIPLCYQAGDPTSNEDPDLVSTDGGFIRVDEAYNIKALVPLSSSLFVLAENGIWRITGADENMFDPTSYTVSKISEEGCISSSSVVRIPNGVAYWGEFGIYTIQQGEVSGEWETGNLIQESIQTLYDNISVDDRLTCVGYYDRFSPSIRWIYGPRGFSLLGVNETHELIFNTKFGVFTKNVIPSVGTSYGPLSVSGSSKIVGVNILRNPKESLYCIVGDYLTTITYSFGGYNTLHTTNDWAQDLIDPTLTQNGVDTEAFLISCRVNGGDTRLRKEVPYITTYFQRTDLDDKYPMDSSCLLQAQWNWTSNSASGKWTTPRQAYRVLQSQVGNEMVVTRNLIRGSGRCVAYKFSSENGKGLHIYGWEYNIQAGEEE